MKARWCEGLCMVLLDFSTYSCERAGHITRGRIIRVIGTFICGGDQSLANLRRNGIYFQTIFTLRQCSTIESAHALLSRNRNSFHNMPREKPSTLEDNGREYIYTKENHICRADIQPILNSQWGGYLGSAQDALQKCGARPRGNGFVSKMCGGDD